MKYFENAFVQSTQSLGIYIDLLRSWMLTEITMAPTLEQYLEILKQERVYIPTEGEGGPMLNFRDGITWMGRNGNSQFANLNIHVMKKPIITSMIIMDENGNFAITFYNTIQDLTFFKKVMINNKECYYLESEKTIVNYSKRMSEFSFDYVHTIGMTKIAETDNIDIKYI